MPPSRLPGGPTQDEILAVSLCKLDLQPGDTVLEIGCGTGRVSVAMAGRAHHVSAIDLRPEAVAVSAENARAAGVTSIGFSCSDALAFLEQDTIYDCAFVGGTKNLTAILPVLARRVKRTIVINAVMVSTVAAAISTLKELGLFSEAVLVQVSRSHDIAGSVMFRPIDPVFVIVARGAACS